MKHKMKRLLGIVLAVSMVLSYIAVPGVLNVVTAEAATEYILNDSFDKLEDWEVSGGTIATEDIDGNAVMVFKADSDTSTYGYVHYPLSSKYEELTLSYNIKFTTCLEEYPLTFTNANSGDKKYMLERIKLVGDKQPTWMSATSTWNDVTDAAGKSVTFKQGTWHTVKMHYKYDATAASATVAVYIDGVLTNIGVNAGVTGGLGNVAAVGMSFYKSTSNVYLDNVKISVADHEAVSAGYTSAAFAKSAYTVGTGETVAAMLTAEPENVLVKDTFTYTSSNPDVATVDENTGAITGVSKGTAVITATGVNDPSLTASANVNVYYLKTMDFETEGVGGWTKKLEGSTLERVAVTDDNHVLKLGANQTSTNAEFYCALGGSFEELCLSYDFMLVVDEGKSESGNNYLPTMTAGNGALDNHCVVIDALSGTYRADSSTTNSQIKYTETNTSESFEADKWYHIEIVYSKTGTTRVYVNGALTNVTSREGYKNDVTAIGTRLFRATTQNLYLDNIRISEREREFVIDQSAALGGNIAMNFTGHAETSSDITDLKVTVGEAASTYKLEDRVFDITIPLPAAEMEKAISVQPVGAQGEPVGRASEYSVKAYLDAVKTYYPDKTALVEATLNYGYYAAKHFNVDTGFEPTQMSGEVPSAGGVASPVSGSLSGVKAKGATLIFQDSITIRYSFELDADADIGDYTFMVGTNQVQPVKSGNVYYVYFTGICPQEYNSEITVTVTKNDSAGELAVTYSAMSYIVRMSAKSTTSDSLKNLLKAMYNYYLAAVEAVIEA